MATETDKKAAVDKFLSGKLAAVDVPAIERELKSLWHEAEGPGASSAVARACSLNLILYTNESDAELKASDVLDQIMLTHPCRAILAIDIKKANSHIDAWVAARCHSLGPGAGKQICCELITVKSQEEDIKALSSVVIPLLVPDLPVFMWWHTDNIEPVMLAPFLSSVNNLIVDSIHFKDIQNSFKQIVSMLFDHKINLHVCDLNWIRLIHWRTILAKAFDTLDFGLTIKDLHKVEALSIEFIAGNIAQMALVTGWIANQLKWKPKKAQYNNDKYTFVFDTEKDGQSSVEWLQAKSDITSSGNIVKLCLKCTDKSPLNIDLCFEDKKPVLKASMRCSKNTDKDALGRGPDPQEEVLVSMALNQITGDMIFKQSVIMASKILDLL